MGGRQSNFLQDTELCKQFLLDEAHGGRYIDMLRGISRRERRVLEIHLDDSFGWRPDAGFGDRVHKNAKRYIELFSKAADSIIGEMEAADGSSPAHMPMQVEETGDVVEVLRAQRMQQQAEATMNTEQMRDAQESFPPSLLRRYEVSITPPTKTKKVSLREVKAGHIGGLVRITGIVTRVSDVKPMVSVATYTCDKCGFEIYQPVNGRSFMPLTSCPSARCQENGSAGRLFLQTRGSKFVKYQEIKIQEMPDQVPIGHIPRSMTVQAHGSCTRQCSPGENVTITGIFLPTKFTGFRAVRAGLIADTYVECMSIKRHKKSYQELGDEITPELESQIDAAADDPNIYKKLASSIAPEIFGHEDVKKALLLMLVGGCTRVVGDGMRIRGDINICLMGDPGVAKSQLLKHIASITPRGVYTTGKGSSGVGLTAAVVRDPVTKDVALEGGALVLADMGICCIDEFDKMEDSDRTAIHEVMEQQTVSIAKGGVTTTLNARTAILAAANPLFGRYNKRLSPTENINLPAALLSRFDLMFLLLDKANRDFDVALAKHVSHVHRFSKHPELDFEPLHPSFIRAYISQARKVEPYVPPELGQHIVQAYVDMRQDDKEAAEADGCQSMLTARQLLSILRLAQALARLRFDEQVSQADVNEAIRLVNVSKFQLEEDEDEAMPSFRKDVLSAVYNIVRDLASARATAGGSMAVKYADVEPAVIHRGYTQEQLNECLEEYANLNVWHVNASRTQITFIMP